MKNSEVKMVLGSTNWNPPLRRRSNLHICDGTVHLQILQGTTNFPLMDADVSQAGVEMYAFWENISDPPGPITQVTAGTKIDESIRSSDSPPNLHSFLSCKQEDARLLPLG